MNAVGLISMQYARPFTQAHFPLFGTMRQLGFNFVELLVPEIDELDLQQTRRALKKANLDVVLAARITLQRNLACDDDASHRAGIDYLKYTADCAHALGARLVGGPLTGNPLVFAGRAPQMVDEKTRLARKKRCVDGLREAGDYAARLGVMLAIEPLNRFESDLLSTTSQAIELLEEVDHPHIQLMLDTFHMAMEEASIPAAICLAQGRLVHFQANENHRGFPGTGSIDWVGVFRALHEINYQGPVSLEPFRRNDDRFGVPIAAWRPPHEDESERLKASVDFIKSHLLLTEYRR